jgi:hypothetical protein
VGTSDVETLAAVLDALRHAAQPERHNGTAFERLVKPYWFADALWGQKLSDVWMWSECPDRDGRGDAGIDLTTWEQQMALNGAWRVNRPKTLRVKLFATAAHYVRTARRRIVDLTATKSIADRHPRPSGLSAKPVTGHQPGRSTRA